MPSASDQLSLAEITAELIKLKLEVTALKSERQFQCEHVVDDKKSGNEQIPSGLQTLGLGVPSTKFCLSLK